MRVGVHSSSGSGYMDKSVFIPDSFIKSILLKIKLGIDVNALTFNLEDYTVSKFNYRDMNTQTDIEIDDGYLVLYRINSKQFKVSVNHANQLPF